MTYRRRTDNTMAKSNTQLSYIST